MRVSQEQMLEWRLFQIPAGAAERKPRAPNEMLQRVTKRKLAEASLYRVLHGVCHWTRSANYGGEGGLPLCITLFYGHIATTTSFIS